jgi:hypothetical protein
MPASLPADDQNPFGVGSSPLGNKLDAEKIRNDIAKMRYTIDHQNDFLREGNPANAQRNGRGTARSTSQKRFGEQSRDWRESQREKVLRSAKKRSASSSSARGTASKTPAS